MSSKEYKIAFVEVTLLGGQPSQEEQLKLYGLNKIASGLDINEAKKPGMMDFAGKYKYNAWKGLVDEGVTQADAEKQYIDLVATLKEKHGLIPEDKMTAEQKDKLAKAQA